MPAAAATRWLQYHLTDEARLRDTNTPDKPGQTYESLLATLAGIMGTLLAILVGFAGAYYIFLREHLSQLRAHSQESKFAICDTLRTLRAAWGASGFRQIGGGDSRAQVFTEPPWSYAFADPELERLVRDAYPSSLMPRSRGVWLPV
jgi:hypothetical protein